MKVNHNPAPMVAPEKSDEGISERDKEGMKKVSKQFESILVNQMVGEMRKTVSRSSLFPESHAERVYRSMLDSEYAQKISETEQIGLSKVIYDQLLQKYRGG